MNRVHIEFQMTALTDIWTGDADGKSNRLITTGLLGSFRWWFEVLVRGLGGIGCDPSNTMCTDDKHCVVCELFGCTGWARKFRFDVLDANGAIQQDQVKRAQTFKMRFTPLRAIRTEEWALLELTLRLVAKFGAIAGKTAFKPTDEAHRQREPHHGDYGLIKLTDPQSRVLERNALGAYVRRSNLADNVDRSWASLEGFWAVPGEYLTRQSSSRSPFNEVLRREQSKNRTDFGAIHDPPAKRSKTKRYVKRVSDSMLAGSTIADRWLAGDQRVSKKVFSFKNPARTFGFVNPSGRHERITFDDIKTRLEAAWGKKLSDGVAIGAPDTIRFFTGEDILEALFSWDRGAA